MQFSPFAFIFKKENDLRDFNLYFIIMSLKDLILEKLGIKRKKKKPDSIEHTNTQIEYFLIKLITYINYMLIVLALSNGENTLIAHQSHKQNL